MDNLTVFMLPAVEVLLMAVVVLLIYLLYYLFGSSGHKESTLKRKKSTKKLVSKTKAKQKYFVLDGRGSHTHEKDIIKGQETFKQARADTLKEEYKVGKIDIEKKPDLVVSIEENKKDNEVIIKENITIDKKDDLSKLRLKIKMGKLNK